jgi:ABC-2 type transport system permease protein
MNMKTVFILARKDLLRLMSDKAFLFMAASQLVLLSLSLTFSQFLPIYASGGMPTPPHYALICVAGDDAFWEAFPKGDPMYERNDPKTGLFYFQQGTYDAVIIAEDYGGRLNGSLPIKADLYVRPGPKKPTILAKTKAILEGIDVSARLARLRIHETPYTEYRLAEKPPSAASSLIYTVLLPLFIVFLSVTAGNLAITLMANESEEKTLETLLSSPITMRDIIDSKSFTCALAALAQLTAWIIAFSLGGIYIAHPILLIAYAMAQITAYIAFGHISHAIGRTRDAAQNIYAIFALPSIVTLLPTAAIPSSLSPLTEFMPSRVIAQTTLSGNMPPMTSAAIAVTIVLALALYAAAKAVADKRGRV